MKLTNLEKMMCYDEGFELKPYKCSANKTTIGIGHNLEANPIKKYTMEELERNGITVKEAFDLLNEQLENREQIARKYSWFKGLNEARQAVIINILYIRPKAIHEWSIYKPALIKAIDAYKFREAGELMKELKMAKQLKRRFGRLIKQFQTGEWEDVYLKYELKI